MGSDVTVLHAYGVVPAGQVEPPRRGIDGRPVELVESGGLAALVSRLDAARFGEQVWREHAEDPDWLTSFAVQHQEVLGAVARRGDVLPFRIPGMYDDEARLRDVLEAERDLLSRGLETLSGHVEWGVQVFLTGPSRSEPPAQPTSGRDYLRRRSAEVDARERASDYRRERVLQAYRRVEQAAAHSVANPPQDPALSGRAEPMLLNSAHLVPREQEAPFFIALAEAQDLLHDEGMVVEVSGPWPAYNFVTVGTEELQA